MLAVSTGPAIVDGLHSTLYLYPPITERSFLRLFQEPHAHLPPKPVNLPGNPRILATPIPAFRGPVHVVTTNHKLKGPTANYKGPHGFTHKTPASTKSPTITACHPREVEPSETGLEAEEHGFKREKQRAGVGTSSGSKLRLLADLHLIPLCSDCNPRIGMGNQAARLNRPASAESECDRQETRMRSAEMLSCTTSLQDTVLQSPGTRHLARTSRRWMQKRQSISKQTVNDSLQGGTLGTRPSYPSCGVSISSVTERKEQGGEGNEKGNVDSIHACRETEISTKSSNLTWGAKRSYVEPHRAFQGSLKTVACENSSGSPNKVLPFEYHYRSRPPIEVLPLKKTQRNTESDTELSEYDNEAEVSRDCTRQSPEGGVTQNLNPSQEGCTVGKGGNAACSVMGSSGEVEGIVQRVGLTSTGWNKEDSEDREGSVFGLFTSVPDGCVSESLPPPGTLLQPAVQPRPGNLVQSTIQPSPDTAPHPQTLPELQDWGTTWGDPLPAEDLRDLGKALSQSLQRALRMEGLGEDEDWDTSPRSVDSLSPMMSPILSPLTSRVTSPQLHRRPLPRPVALQPGEQRKNEDGVSSWSSVLSSDDALGRQEDIWQREVEESLSFCRSLSRLSRPKHVDFLRITPPEDDIISDSPLPPEFNSGGPSAVLNFSQPLGNFLGGHEASYDLNIQGRLNAVGMEVENGEYTTTNASLAGTNENQERCQTECSMDGMTTGTDSFVECDRSGGLGRGILEEQGGVALHSRMKSHLQGLFTDMSDDLISERTTCVSRHCGSTDPSKQKVPINTQGNYVRSSAEVAGCGVWAEPIGTTDTTTDNTSTNQSETTDQLIVWGSTDYLRPDTFTVQTEKSEDRATDRAIDIIGLAGGHTDRLTDWGKNQTCDQETCPGNYHKDIPTADDHVMVLANPSKVVAVETYPCAPALTNTRMLFIKRIEPIWEKQSTRAEAEPVFGRSEGAEETTGGRVLRWGGTAGTSAHVDSPIATPTQPSSPQDVLAHPAPDSLQDGVSTPDSPQNGVPATDSLQDGVPDPDSLQDGVPDPDSPQDGVPDPDSLQDGVPDPDSPQDGVPDPDSLQDGVPDPDSLQDGVPDPDSLQDGVPDPDSPQNGVPATDSLQDGVPDPDSLQDGVPDPDSLQDGVPDPDSPQDGVPDPDSPQDGVPAPENGPPPGTTSTRATFSPGSPGIKPLQLYNLFTGLRILRKEASVSDPALVAEVKPPLSSGPGVDNPLRGQQRTFRRRKESFLDQLSQLLNLDKDDDKGETWELKGEERTEVEMLEAPENITAEPENGRGEKGKTGEKEVDNPETAQDTKEVKNEVQSTMETPEYSETSENLEPSSPLEPIKSPASSAESAFDAFKAFFTPKPLRRDGEKGDMEAVRRKAWSFERAYKTPEKKTSDFKSEALTPGDGDDRPTPGRLHAIWPPTKEERVGLKYTEAEHQAGLLELKRECKEEVENLQDDFRKQLSQVREDKEECVYRLECSLLRLQSELARGPGHRRQDLRDVAVSTSDDLSPRAFRTVCVQTDRQTFLGTTESENGSIRSPQLPRNAPKRLDLSSISLKLTGWATSSLPPVSLLLPSAPPSLPQSQPITLQADKTDPPPPPPLSPLFTNQTQGLDCPTPPPPPPGCGPHHLPLYQAAAPHHLPLYQAAAPHHLPSTRLWPPTTSPSTRLWPPTTSPSTRLWPPPPPLYQAVVPHHLPSTRLRPPTTSPSSGS
ncbi:hypothetical protein DPEC_G00116380 [Dallia pectoralis]|uniref:Uncharacterized protein n=1 Tax=Dallia pectoralis TaxID=75939 RepID=A0ACC2GUU7_DALPE|nr:hypothetical protein DPEC_G00116380 [Dallia pectoralis]